MIYTLKKKRVKLDKIIGEKRSREKNQLMVEMMIYTKIQCGNTGECKNRQTHMKVEFNVVFKKFTDPCHRTKVSVKC